jgi:hypothetical protein
MSELSGCGLFAHRRGVVGRFGGGIVEDRQDAAGQRHLDGHRSGTGVRNLVADTHADQRLQIELVELPLGSRQRDANAGAMECQHRQRRARHEVQCRRPRTVQDPDVLAVPPSVEDRHAGERECTQRTDSGDRVVEAVAAAHQRDPFGVELGGERQGQFGVGLVLVGGMARDVGMTGCPGERVVGDRVEVADQVRGFQPSGKGVVEPAVDGHPDRVVRGLAAEPGHEVGVECRCPGDDDDVFVHDSSAGITRIRFSGR